MTSAEYSEIFQRECAQTYPVVDTLESRLGYALDKERLENAARVLACPLKRNPPCWQHGRVVYSVLRKMLSVASSSVQCLDIGTAKGFSALCAQWALLDSGREGHVISVDVIDPASRVSRNTVAELSGYLTLYETIATWPEARGIKFLHATGVNWLTMNRQRVHFAFVDGKHNYAAVSQELDLLLSSQVSGDVIVADDIQIPGVRRAVEGLEDEYYVEYLEVLPNRQYAIATRRR